MEVNLIQYLIVCPLVFIAGFIDAIGGGGGLISLPAYIIAGLPIHNAISTNKMSACMGTATATYKYARDGFINIRYAFGAVITALIGSTIGANIALRIDDGFFRILMLIILPVTAFYVFKTKSLSVEKEPYSTTKTILLCAAIAFVIGIYDGFYGPGTGTFLILLLTAVAHLDLHSSNGICKAINFSTNIASLVVFLVNGTVLIPLGLAAGVFNIAGNYLGARSFEKGGDKITRPVILIVLAIFFVKTIIELIQ